MRSMTTYPPQTMAAINDARFARTFFGSTPTLIASDSNNPINAVKNTPNHTLCMISPFLPGPVNGCRLHTLGQSAPDLVREGDTISSVELDKEIRTEMEFGRILAYRLKHLPDGAFEPIIISPNFFIVNYLREDGSISDGRRQDKQ